MYAKCIVVRKFELHAITAQNDQSSSLSTIPPVAGSGRDKHGRSRVRLAWTLALPAARGATDLPKVVVIHRSGASEKRTAA